MVVVDDGVPDPASGHPRWRPLELALEGGVWRGTLDAESSAQLRYVIQAVDRFGNVSWHETVSVGASLESGLGTGIELRLPAVTTVELQADPTDLRLVLSDRPDPVVAGGVLEYSLVAQNQGPNVATALRAELMLPAGANYLGFIADSSWICSKTLEIPIVVLCTRPFLEVNQTSVVQVQVRAPSQPGWVVASASLTGGGEDLNPIDNQESEITRIEVSNQADIAVTIDNGVVALSPGLLVNYTVGLSNSGPSTVDMAFLGLDVAALEDVETTADRGAFDGERWDGMGLAVGETAFLEIRGRIPASSTGWVTVSVLAGLPLGYHDPDDSDNFDMDADPIVDMPPAISAVTTVADTGDGNLTQAERTRSALTQILIFFSKQVIGTEDPENYHWLAAGEDGEVQSEVCGVILGDDQIIEPSVTYRDGERTAALRQISGDALPRGRYRLAICSGIEDLQGQPLAGLPWVLEFEVEVVHLLESPNFDEGLSGWQWLSPLNGLVITSQEDAGGATTSGSVHASGVFPEDPAVLWQCLQIEPQSRYRYGGRKKILSTNGALLVSAWVELFESLDCNGEPISTVATPSGFAGVSGEWSPIPMMTVDSLDNTNSMQVHFGVVSKSVGAYEALLDDVYVYVVPEIFSDGFETGDLSRWSDSVP
ncbi:MAG: hypothetical protein HC897_00275 [Thermoanaerobaculia bacterium]|nr:hypothetical protein [Thermoanaerobaculia bacterium]